MSYDRVKLLAELQPGDLVKHRGSGEVHVVTVSDGSQITAVKTINSTNPDEWLVYKKASSKKRIMKEGSLKGKKMALTKRQQQWIADVVEKEGFDYGFVHYTDFAEIKDAEFRRLYDAFIEAREQLIDYCHLPSAE